jgi:hypothetical protein
MDSEPSVECLKRWPIVGGPQSVFGVSADSGQGVCLDF